MNSTFRLPFFLFMNDNLAVYSLVDMACLPVCPLRVGGPGPAAVPGATGPPVNPRRGGKMTNLPATTPIADPVRFAKTRWRIEHDYRETQTRPAPGPLRRPHLARLAPPRHPRHAAQVFLNLRRYDPKACTAA